MAGVVVYPNVACLSNIGLLLADIAGSSLKLFKNQIVPGPSTVIADFDEADYTGYVAKTITAGLPAYVDPAGGAAFQIATQQFNHTGGGTSNIVYGFWVENAGGDLKICGAFDAGIVMQQVGDAIPMDVKFFFGN